MSTGNEVGLQRIAEPEAVAHPKALPEHLFTSGEEFWQYVTFVYRDETHWWERWTEHRDYTAACDAVERERARGHHVVILRRLVMCGRFSEVSDAK